MGKEFKKREAGICTIHHFAAPATTWGVRWVRHPEPPALLSWVGDSYLMKQHFKSTKWKVHTLGVISALCPPWEWWRAVAVKWHQSNITICYWRCHLHLGVSCSPRALLFTAGEHAAHVCQPEVISELLSPEGIFRQRDTQNTFFSLINTLYYSVRERILHKGPWLPKLVGEMSKPFCCNQMNIFIHRWNNWT